MTHGPGEEAENPITNRRKKRGESPVSGLNSRESYQKIAPSLRGGGKPAGRRPWRNGENGRRFLVDTVGRLWHGRKLPASL